MNAGVPIGHRDWSGCHVIIGGGIIGLAIGWQLARRGERVTIVEKGEAGKGASWIAAGMLAPYAEIGFEEVEFFRMCRESLELYPQMLEELRDDLSDESTEVPRFDTCGTLLIALTQDDDAYLKRFHEFQLRIGLRSTKLTAAEAREREPLLSTRVKSALYLEADSQINNRRLVASLRAAFIARGGELLELTDAKALTFEHARSVTISAGACANAVSETVRTTNPVRPVKGQIVRLRPSEEVRLHHMVRTPRGYVLQKDDGSIVVGATSEERGFDTSVTAGHTMDILRNAYDVLPIVYELEIAEIQAGLRPATRSHVPHIGYSGSDNIFFAIGHYRHGILLTPYTAYTVANSIISQNSRVEAKAISNIVEIA